MEKMFVYSETVDAAVAAEYMNGRNSIEPRASTAGEVSLQCKRYRVVLEQCMASAAVASRMAANPRTQFDTRQWAQLQRRG